MDADLIGRVVGADGPMARAPVAQVLHGTRRAHSLVHGPVSLRQPCHLCVCAHPRCLRSRFRAAHRHAVVARCTNIHGCMSHTRERTHARAHTRSSAAQDKWRRRVSNVAAACVCVCVGACHDHEAPTETEGSLAMATRRSLGRVSTNFLCSFRRSRRTARRSSLMCSCHRGPSRRIRSCSSGIRTAARSAAGRSRACESPHSRHPPASDPPT